MSRLEMANFQITNLFIMKKQLLLAAFAVFTMSASAQTTLTQAVDFTVTFTDGTTFNLFDKLGEGKYVCIDWFFTTCPPCQANQAFYTEAYQNFGCNAGDVFFVSIENTVGDDAVHDYEVTYAGDNAPPAASGTEGGGIEAEELYNIGAFPTFILIAPDGSIVEQDMWPLTDGAATFAAYFENYDIEPMPCAVGIDEASAELSFSSYPNPASEQLTLNLGGYSNAITIEVMNLVGERVYSATTDGEQHVINVSELANGNYIVRLSSGDQVVQQQVAVMH